MAQIFRVDRTIRYELFNYELEHDLNFRLGDIVNVRVFSQHLIILSNYEDATKLMYEAKYSDRLQTVMLQDLYVSPTIPTKSLICFTTGWA